MKKGICILTVILVSGIMLSAGSSPVSAGSVPVSSDVHGITYKETSLLRLAVLPGSTMSYGIIDWYVYHDGAVEIHENGELVESFFSSGLTVVTRNYAIGESHKVVINLDNGLTFVFDFRTMRVIDIRDIDRDTVILTMTEREFLFEVVKVGFFSGLVAMVAFWLVYRKRRDENRDGVRYD
jgi:hypothetical protein